MTSWPGRKIWFKNAFAMWYLSENELIWEIWGHIDLKQPRNLKLDIKSAKPNSPKSCENPFVDFISSQSFLTFTNSESWQFSRFIGVLHVYFAL